MPLMHAQGVLIPTWPPVASWLRVIVPDLLLPPLLLLLLLLLLQLLLLLPPLLLLTPSATFGVALAQHAAWRPSLCWR